MTEGPPDLSGLFNFTSLEDDIDEREKMVSSINNLQSLRWPRFFVTGYFARWPMDAIITRLLCDKTDGMFCVLTATLSGPDWL